MKIAPLVLLCAAAAAHATTAYDALGTVGKQRGEKTLDRVVEVRGMNGSPSPRTWKITVEDGASRSGVREFDVEGTKLVSERAPASGATGTALNVNRLNLDSDGVNTIAVREAKKAGYRFDHLDYFLRAGSKGGTPVWEVRLVDGQSGDVATLNLSADTGTILSSEGLTPSRTNTAPPPQRPGSRVVEERPPEPRYPAPRAERGERRAPNETLQKAGDKVNNFVIRSGYHLEHRFRQLGDRLHNLFTGDYRNSAGEEPSHDDYSDPRLVRPQGYEQPEREPRPQPRTYRDANGTEYTTRPRD